MASFNDQVQNLRSSGSSFSIFAEGIKPKFMSGDNPILFRLLPAYNYDDRDAAGNVNLAGWLPCRTPDGSLTAWGSIMWISRGIGHGSGKGNSRRDYVSPATFGQPGIFDPVAHLYATAAADAEWSYLVKDQNDAAGRLVERAALSKAGEHLVANIVELTAGGMPEVVLGLMGKSACDALVSPHKNGLLFQRANNVTEDMIRQNYLVQWSCGDVTNPIEGPVLVLQKGKENGKMSKYQVQLSTDARGMVRRLQLGPDILQCRYDLTDLSRLILKRTDEEAVQLLVETFNGRGPRGYHEYVLLKQAFGGMFKIPEAPSAPAASPTVQSGFGQAPGGFTPPAQNFAPQQQQQGGFGPVPLAAGFGPQSATQAPAYATPAAMSSNYAPQAAHALVATFTPPAAPSAPSVASGVGNAAAAAAAQMLAATPPPATASSGPAAPGPTAPGDSLDAKKAEFLAQMRSSRGPTGPAR